MTLPDNILTPVGNLRGQLTSGGLIPGLPVVYGEASGAIASFNMAADAYLIDLITNIEASQSGSGDPAMDNIRPITGYTEAEIHRADGVTPHIIDDAYILSWSDNAGIVYFGEYNVITGELKVTYLKLVLDGSQDISSVNWRPAANSVGWYYNLNQNIMCPPNINTQTSALSDKLKSESYINVFNNDIDSFALYATAGYERLCIRVKDTSLTTKPLINDFLSNNPITIIYPLSTPVIYNLPPFPIKALEGDNEIWSDTGDINKVKFIVNAGDLLQWVYDNLYTP